MAATHEENISFGNSGGRPPKYPENRILSAMEWMPANGLTLAMLHRHVQHPLEGITKSTLWHAVNRLEARGKITVVRRAGRAPIYLPPAKIS